MTGVTAGSEDLRGQLEQMTSQLVALERRAKTLAELNRLLSQGSDPLALAQRAVDLVMRATAASGTYFYRWDPEVERLVMRVATTGRVAAYLGKIQLRLGEGINGWSALMRQTVVIDDDIEHDPRFVGLPGVEEDEFRSMLAVPIAAPGGDLLGVFSLYSEKPAMFDKNVVELATEVGGLLASGLVQAEILKDLRRESSAARFLLDVSGQATSSLQRCVDELAGAIRQQVDADLCVVELAERGIADAARSARPGVAFAERVDRSIVHAGSQVRHRGDLPDLVERLGGRLSKINSSFGALSPEGAVTCYRIRPFRDADEGVVEALGAQAAVLIASLRNHAVSPPLAGRLAAGASREDPREMLRDLGWSGGPASPVLIRLRSARHCSAASFEHVVDAVHEVCEATEGALMVPSPPLVTVLLPHDPDSWKSFEPTLRRALRQFRLDVAVGIGSLARDENALLAALDHAESALTWAELLDDSLPIVHYADIAHLTRLPQVALDIGEELREATAYFAEVVRYDHRHGTNLAGTLDCYLATRCSIVETAKTLFIHRNTLRQRLSRIEEITGRPVEHMGDWAIASLAARMTFASAAPSSLASSS